MVTTQPTNARTYGSHNQNGRVISTQTIFLQDSDTAPVYFNLKDDLKEETATRVQVFIRGGPGYEIIEGRDFGESCNPDYLRGCGTDAAYVRNDDEYEHWLKVVPVDATIDEGEDAVFKIERFAIAAPSHGLYYENPGDRCVSTDPTAETQIPLGRLDYRRIDFALSGHETTVESSTLAALSSRQIHLPAGDSNVELRLPTIDDTISGSSRTLEFSISARTYPSVDWYRYPYYCIVPNAGSASVEVSDNDVANYTVSVSPDEVDESAGTTTLDVTVRQSVRNEDDVVVTPVIKFGNEAPVQQPAATSADFEVLSPPPNNGTVTIPAGQRTSSTQLRIRAVSDTEVEQDEKFSITLVEDVGTITPAVVTIIDDDVAPKVAMKAATASVGEADGSVKVCATLSPVSTSTVTVDIASGDGTANAGGDYTAIASNAQLSFAPDDTEQCLDVAVTDDDVDEEDETFAVSLSNVSGGSAILDTQTVTTVTIGDDDTRGVTVSEADLDVPEGGSASYTVVLDSEPTGDVTVTIAGHTGTDLSLNDDTLTFTPTTWDTVQTVTVTAAEDTDAVNDQATLTHTIAGADYAGETAASVTIDIIDNDGASAGIVLTVNPDTLAENAGQTAVTVTATLDGATHTVPVAVTVSVAADSASTADFAAVSNFTVSIAAGDTEDSATFQLTPTNDTLDEADEILQISGTASGFTVTGTSITLTDDDGPPELTIADASASESDTEMIFELTLSTASGKDSVVDFVTTTPGSNAAETNVDFVSNAGNVLFRKGATSKSIAITLRDDHLDEADETFSISLRSPFNLTLASNSATGTIIDDDDPPTVVMDAATQTVTESQTTQVCASLDAQSGRKVEVDIASADDTADAGDDYTAIPTGTSLTFNPGVNKRCTGVVTLDDAVAEGDETFSVTLSNPTHATVGNPNTTTVTIDDNDAAPLVSMNLATLRTEESNSPATVCATLSSVSASTVTVDIASSDGTATAGADYTAIAANAQLSFAFGDTERCLDVSITDDEVDEADETFDVTLSNVTGGGATLGTQTDTTVTIGDDDTRGVTVSDTDLDIREGGSDSYTVVLESEPTGTVTVTIAGHIGTDLTLNDDTLTFTPSDWNTAQTVTVSAAEDTDAVNDQATLTHTIAGADYAGESAASVTVDVIDDDTASTAITLSVDPDTVPEGGGATNVDVTATLDGATHTVPVAVTVSVTADSASTADFAAVSNFTVTIAMGDTEGSGTFQLTPTDDTMDEPDETLQLTGAATGFLVAGTTLTIIDDDSRPFVKLVKPEVTGTNTTDALRFLESEDAEVCVTLEEASGFDVTVNLSTSDDSAVAPGDYTALPVNTTLTVVAGDLEGCRTIEIADDRLDEDDETFTVQLSNVVNATPGDVTSVTIEILDNDGLPTVTMDAATQAVTESRTARMCASLNTVSGRTVLVDIASADGTADAGDDYTAIPSGTSLTFVPGSSNQCTDVVTLDDAVAEANETFSVTLSNPTNATVGSPNATTVTIDDNDAAPVVSMKSATLRTRESDGSVTVCATLSLVSSSAVMVDIASGGGTATAGADYTAIPTNTGLTFTPGSTEQCLDISVADDEIDEAEETFDVTLSNVTGGGATLGTQTATTVTIGDNDTRGVTVSESDLDIPEGGSDRYTVVLDSEPTGTVTVSVNGHADSDLTVNPTTLTFTPSDWESTQTVTVSAADDTDAEDDSVILRHTVNGADYTGATATSVKVNVTDNDSASSGILLTVDPDIVAEDAGQTAVSVTATLDGATHTEPVAVTVSVAADSASTADFAAVSNFTVTIATGDTEGSATFQLTPTNDTLDEPDETLQINGTATGFTVTGTTLTLTDDDAAPVLTLPATLSVTEADDARVCATLNPASGRTVTVPIGSVNGTARSGVDYTAIATNAELTFTPGITEACRTVVVTDDAYDEEDETFRVRLGAPVNATLGSPNETLVTVTDNDDPPTVTMDTATKLVSESQTTQVCASLDALSGRTVLVAIASADGTADAGDDYTAIAAGTSLTFIPGSDKRCIDVDALDDAVAEINETFTVTLSNPTHATVGNPNSTTVTIDDNDAAPLVSLKSATLRASESDGTANVCAVLSPVSSSTVTVDIASTNGTATAGADYTAIPTNTALAFTAGSTEQCLDVTIVDDEIDENDETFDVTLLNVTGGSASLGTQTATTITIRDDDTRGVTVSDTELNVAEGGSESYTVVLESEPTGNVTVTVAGHAGTDVTLNDDSLTFTPSDWDTTQTVTVSAGDDTDAEDDDLILRHTVSGADYAGESAASVNVKVLDNDTASTVITLSANPDTVAEDAGQTAVMVTATLDGATQTTPVAVTVAVTADSASTADFAAVSNFTVTIGTGDTEGSATFQLTPTNDVLDEPDETLQINGTAAGFTVTGATLTLTDDDAPPVLTLPATLSVTEADDLRVCATMSPASGRSVTVPVASTDGTARSGSDYTAIAASAELTFAPGATEACRTVVVIDDSYDEENETFRVRLGTPVNATLGSPDETLVTVTDNDSPPVVTMDAATQAVNESQTARVCASLDALSGRTVVVNIASANGTADAGDDYTAIPTGTSLTFVPGSDNRCIDVSTLDDAVAEASESFSVTLSNPVQATVGTPNTTTVTIDDNDAAPKVAMKTATRAVGEGDGSLTLCATLSPISASTVTVDIASGGGTATAGADYTAIAANAQLSFVSGDAERCVDVAVADDDVDESDETFDVTLSNVTGGFATLGTQADTTVTISDNDTRGVTLSESELDITEGDSDGYTVVLDSEPTGTVTVTVGGHVGSDLTINPTTLTYTSTTWSTAKTVTVSTVDDTDAEDDNVILRHTVSGADYAGESAASVNVNVLDNDTASTAITLSVDPDTVPEGGGATDVTVTAQLDAATFNVDTTVRITVTANTAETEDFSQVSPFDVTIPRGTSSGSTIFSLTPTNDSMDEPDETLDVNGTAAGFTVTGASLIIDDDDSRTFVKLVTPVVGGTTEADAPGVLRIPESDNAEVCVTLEEESGFNVTVDLSTSDGSAVAPDDYTALPANASLTIAAGDLQGCTTINIVDDGLDEAEETFTVQLSNVVNATPGDDSSVTIQILDNDDPPTVTMVVATQAVTESQTTSVCASLDAISGRTVEVDIASANGTAVAGDDYTAISTGTSLTFVPGTDNRCTAVATLDDAVAEANETFTVTLSNPTHASIGNPNTTIVTIDDNDGTPKVAMKGATLTVDETDGSVTVCATLSPVSSNAVTVNIASGGGTATADDDYTAIAANTQLSFASGNAEQCHDITIADDDLDEADETFDVTLSNVTGGSASLGTQMVTTVTIDDNDIRGVTVSETELDVAEGGNESYTVVLESEPTGNVTVTISGHAGTDLTLDDDTLTFTSSDWDTAQTVTVTAGEDNDAVNDTATLSHTVAGADYAGESVASVSVDVLDNDSASAGIILTVNPDTVAEDAGQTAVTLTATLDGATHTEPVTVTASVVGDSASAADFTAVGNVTVTIAAGDAEGSATFQLTPVNDAMDEPDETLDVNGIATGFNVTGATVTLTDDDAAPVLTLPATLTVTEADDARVCATLNPASGRTVTVPVSSVDGTARSGTDYTAISAVAELEFVAGVTEACVSVVVTDDAYDEEDETFRVSLGTPVNATLGSQDETLVTVTDNDDPPTVTMDAATQAVTESQTTQVCASLDALSGRTVLVAIASADGTADAGDDYTAITVGTSLTFIPGSDNRCTDVVTLEDALAEGSEIFSVTLSNPTHATVGSPNTTTVTIDDNDAAPRVAMKAATRSVGEAEGSVAVCATLSPVSSNTVTADISSTDDTADAGDDYTAIVANAQLSFAPGDAERCLDISVTDDDVDETDETFDVTLSNVTGGDATLGSQTTTTITIDDDDTRGVSVSTAELEVDEGDSESYTVVLDSEPTANVTVTVAGHNGTDLTLNRDTLTFTPSDWETLQTVSVTAGEDDDAVNDQATLTHTVAGADYAGETVDSVNVEVQDNDTASTTITLSAEPDTVAEDAGQTEVTIKATLDSATHTTPVAVTVSVAADSASTADFAAVSDFTVTIAAGDAEGSATFQLTPTDDTMDELDETLQVNGTATGFTVTGATLTITDDDDAPVLTLPATLTVTEADDARVCAVLSPASGRTVTVPVASADGTARDGSDYAALAADAELEIAPGTTEACVTVVVTDDGYDEEDETFRVNLGAPVNATLGSSVETLVTVTDNDDPPTVTMDASTQAVTESQTTSVCASLDALSGRTVLVNIASTDGTADAGDDYTAIASGTSLTFVPGSSNQCTDVVTLDDAVAEGNETFTVTLSNPVHATIGNPNTTTVTIDDNDAAPKVAMKAATQSVDEADGALTVCATLSPVSSSAVTVDIASGGGTATVGADYTAIASNAQLNFTAGDAERCVDVTVADDEVDEADETFDVTLSNVSGGGATLGTQTITAVTITDDDLRGVTISETELDIPEGASSSYTVVLESEPTGTVTVTVAGHADTDLTLNDDTLTFTPSDWGTTQTVTVSAAEDTDAVDDTATLSHTVAGADYAGESADAVTVNVLDDDTASTTITLSVLPDTVAEDAGQTSVTVTATLDGATHTTPVAVTVSVVGDTASAADFAAVSNFTVTIASGEAEGSATFLLTPTNDSSDEPDETLTIDGTATGFTVTGTTLTLTDDDAAPAVTLPATLTVAESANAEVCVTLDEVSGFEVTVDLSTGDGSAVAPADYTALPEDASLTIDAGDVEGCTTIDIVDDALDEDDETFTVQLNHVVNATLGSVNATTVTVTDNDDPPSVVMDAASQAVIESQTARVCASLDSLSGRTVEVDIASADGTADAGSDYTSVQSGSSLTFVPGSSNQCAKVVTLDDAVAEASETFSVTLSNPTNATVGDPNATTVTIDDNDGAPKVAMQAATMLVGEADGSVTVCTTMSPVSSSAVTVDIASSDGTATADTDYTKVPTNTVLTFTAGSNEQCLDIAVTDDDVDEANETFTVTLSDVTGESATLGTQTTTTVTIEDNDTRGVTVSETDLDVPEGGSQNYTVVLDTEPTGNVTVTVAGHADSDLTLNDDALTFTPSDWDTGQTVTVNAAEDTDAVDDRETLTHTVAGADYADETAASVTVDVIDNDGASSSIALTLDPDTVAEDAGQTAVSVTATLNGATHTEPVTVSVSVVGDTASAEDFAEVGNVSVTIETGDGNGSTTFQLTPTNDTLDEPDETLQVNGTAPDFTVTGATLTLIDDDAPPVLTLPATLTVTEAEDARICAVLNPASGRTVTVPVTSADGTASSGTDYTAIDTNTDLTFAPGATEACVTVIVTEDDLDEEEETFHVSLGAAVNATLGSPFETLVTVTDNDDPPTVAMDTATQAVSESQTARVCASLNTLSGRTVTVPVTSADGTADAGTDYSAIDADTLLTFIPGSSNRCIEIATLDDDVAENAETFLVTLGDPTNATVGQISTTTVTIDDNEGAPKVSLTAATRSTPEADSSIDVCASVTPATSDVVSVAIATEDETASSGSDYVPISGNSRLTFDAGHTNACQTIAILDDRIDEDNEVFRVVIEDPRNAELGLQASTDITILDNDERGITVEPTSLSLHPGETKDYEVTLDTMPTDDVTVDVEVPDDIDAMVSPPQLQFSQSTWSIAQSVDVTLATNSDPRSFTLIHVVRGGDYEDHEADPVEVVPNDSPQTDVEITLSVSPSRVNEGAAANGEAVELTATHDGDPQNNDIVVSVSLNSDTAADHDFVKNEPMELTIPANDTGATITFEFSTLDDDIAEEDESVLVAGSAGDHTVVAARLTIEDDDERGIHVSDESIRVVEQDQDGASVQVRLTSEPVENVQVSVTPSDDSLIEVEPTELTFSPANWNVDQTVKVTAKANEDQEDRSTEIVLAVDEGDYRTAPARTIRVHIENEAFIPYLTFESVMCVEKDRLAVLTGVLTAPSPIAASLSYRTVERTAKPNSDYMPLEGTLDIPAQASTLEVIIELVDDGMDESEEMFVLELHSNVNVQLAQKFVEVTIVDDDTPGNVYSSWLGRYGRSIAQNMVDTVSERVERSNSQDATDYLTASSELITSQLVQEPNGEVSLDRSESLESIGRWVSRGVGGMRLPREYQWHHSLTDGAGTRDSLWTFWGRVAENRFDGAQHGLALSGDVSNTTVGFDVSSGRWLAGTAISRDRGNGSVFGSMGTQDADETMPVVIESTLVAPYARFNIDATSRMWFVGGHAAGDALFDVSNDYDLSVNFGAFGSSIDMTGWGSMLGLDRWSTATDMLYVQTEGTPLFVARDVQSRYGRIRAIVDGSTDQLFAISRLTGNVKLAARYDLGDLETGFGLEVRGGLAYRHPNNLFEFRTDAHALALHQDAEYGEWGVNAEFTLTPQAYARAQDAGGFAATLTTSLGTTGSHHGQLDHLWIESRRNFGSSHEARMDEVSLELEYSMRALHERLLVTPYFGTDVFNSVARRIYFGGRIASSKFLVGSVEYVRGTEFDAQDEIWLRIQLTP